MDDLKVVFYIVVAIVWMIYNNYKKVSEASKKRDISKPFEETIDENWPKDISPPPPPPVYKSPEKQQKPKPVTAPSFSRKTESLKREPIRRERLSANYKFQQAIRPKREGGNLQPSKIVQFQEVTQETEPYNQFADEIRNADFRQGIILAEVLQRPYI